MGSIGVVLDTNVLVSALGFGGPPLDALFRALDEDVELIVSEATLDELERVMTYEHLPFSSADRVQFLSILRREARVIDTDSTIEVVRDSDDDKFIEVAIDGDADYVVSGDQDLLDLGSYEAVDVVSPADFLDLVA